MVFFGWNADTKVQWSPVRIFSILNINCCIVIINSSRGDLSDTSAVYYSLLGTAVRSQPDDFVIQPEQLPCACCMGFHVAIRTPLSTCDISLVVVSPCGKSALFNSSKYVCS